MLSWRCEDGITESTIGLPTHCVQMLRSNTSGYLLTCLILETSKIGRWPSMSTNGSCAWSFCVRSVSQVTGVDQSHRSSDRLGAGRPDRFLDRSTNKIDLSLTRSPRPNPTSDKQCSNRRTVKPCLFPNQSKMCHYWGY